MNTPLERYNAWIETEEAAKVREVYKDIIFAMPPGQFVLPMILAYLLANKVVDPKTGEEQAIKDIIELELQYYINLAKQL